VSSKAIVQALTPNRSLNRKSEIQGSYVGAENNIIWQAIQHLISQGEDNSSHSFGHFPSTLPLDVVGISIQFVVCMLL